MDLVCDRYKDLFQPAQRRYICDTKTVFTSLVNQVNQILSRDPVVQTLQVNKIDISQQLQEAEANVRQLTQQLELLQSQQSNQSTRHLAELKKKDDELAALKTQVQDRLDQAHQDHVNRLTDEIAQLKARLAAAADGADSQATIQQQARDIEQLSLKLLHSETALQAFKETMEQDDGLGEQIIELQRQLHLKPSDPHTLQNLNDQLAEVTADRDDIRAKLARMNDSAAMLVQKDDEIQSMRTQLQDAMQIMQQAQQSMRQMAQQLEAEKKTVKELREQLADTEKQLAKSKKENQRLQKRIDTILLEAAEQAKAGASGKKTDASRLMQAAANDVDDVDDPDYIDVYPADQLDDTAADTSAGTSAASAAASTSSASGTCPIPKPDRNKYKKYGNYVPCPDTTPQSQYCVPSDFRKSDAKGLTNNTITGDVCLLSNEQYKLGYGNTKPSFRMQKIK